MRRLGETRKLKHLHLLRTSRNPNTQIHPAKPAQGPEAAEPPPPLPQEIRIGVIGLFSNDATNKAALKPFLPSVQGEPEIFRKAFTLPGNSIFDCPTSKEKRSMVSAKRKMKHVVRKIESAQVVSKTDGFGKCKQIIRPVVDCGICNNTLATVSDYSLDKVW